MKISEAVNKLMEDRGENAYSLAPKVRMTQPTIYRIVTGQTLEPKQENIDKLAKYFGVSADALRRGEIVPAGTPQHSYPTPEAEPSSMTADELLAAYVAKLVKEGHPADIEAAPSDLKRALDKALRPRPSFLNGKTGWRIEARLLRSDSQEVTSPTPNLARLVRAFFRLRFCSI